MYWQKWLRQKAVYWSPGFVDGFGQRQYSEPIEVSVRWEDTEIEFVDKDGERKLSTCKVITAEDLSVDGYVWLGKLSDVTDLVTPINNPDVKLISRVQQIPTLRAHQFLKTMWC